MTAPQPLLPIRNGVAERLHGVPLVVLLDVDGTLAPISSRPDAALVPPETRRIVAALAARTGVYVALVSGRAAADARRMVSVANAWVIGNHGYEIAGPDGEEMVDPQAASYRATVALASRRLAPQLAPVPGVILEDKGWTLSIHYRLADPAVVPRLRSTIEETIKPLGLRLTTGKLVFEVRPPARVDKGTAVVTLGLRLGAFKEESSVVFVGDDATDEDAFRALRSRSRRAVTVRVTHDDPTPTAAEFELGTTADVRTFLEWLVQSRN
ncbi:MAG TPA: trehalose-phosphatase [Gemmatimonadaceae bacterium]|nr:trehalose-phosphatase [Gemmatimonadaceae bacterium]